MRMFLRIGIVFIVIDRLAHIILSLVDLLMLLRSHVAAIRRTIIRDLTVDARLTPFDVPRLTRSHLSRANALRNPLLLILSPHAGSGERRILRTPAIHTRKITAVRPCRLHMTLLLRGGQIGRAHV